MKDFARLPQEEFTRALVEAGRSDGPSPGAWERALHAVSAPGAAVSTLLVKVVVMAAVAVGLGGGAFLVRRHASSPTAPVTAPARIEQATPAVSPVVPPQSAPLAEAPAVAEQKRRALPPLATIEPRYPERATHCSEEGSPVAMTFENHLDVAVDLDWIDGDCSEELIARVEPHDRHRGTSYTRSYFWVQDSATKKLLKRIPPSSVDRDPSLVYLGGELPLTGDGPPRECAPADWGRTRMSWTWVNTASYAVDVFWVDTDCKEEHVLTLAPGDRHRESTYWAYPWRFRNATSHQLIHEFMPSFLPHWDVSVP